MNSNEITTWQSGTNITCYRIPPFVNTTALVTTSVKKTTQPNRSNHFTNQDQYPSQSPPTSQNKTTQSNTSSPSTYTGLIVGLVVCFLVIIAVILFIVFFLLRKRKHQKSGNHCSLLRKNIKRAERLGANVNSAYITSNTPTMARRPRPEGKEFENDKSDDEEEEIGYSQIINNKPSRDVSVLSGDYAECMFMDDKTQSTNHAENIYTTAIEGKYKKARKPTLPVKPTNLTSSQENLTMDVYAEVKKPKLQGSNQSLDTADGVGGASGDIYTQVDKTQQKPKPKPETKPKKEIPSKPPRIPTKKVAGVDVQIIENDIYHEGSIPPE